MLGLRGSDKRGFLNQVAGVMTLGVGLFGAFLGGYIFGFWGAVVGFFVGCGVGGSIAVKGRYHR